MALTKAQLEALKNSLLASQQPIIASTHRQLIQNVIDEMYDSQSRGNLLAGVQIDGTTTTGDTLLLIRAGEMFLVPSSLFGGVGTLTGLGDVVVIDEQGGDILSYDAVDGVWKNVSLDGLFVTPAQLNAAFEGFQLPQGARLINADLILTSSTAGTITAEWVDFTGQTETVTNAALAFNAAGLPSAGNFRFDIVQGANNGTVSVKRGIEGSASGVAAPSADANNLILALILWAEDGTGEVGQPGNGNVLQNDFSVIRFTTQVTANTTGLFAKLLETELSVSGNYSIILAYAEPRDAFNFGGSGAQELRLSFTADTSRVIIAQTVQVVTSQGSTGGEFVLYQLAGNRVAVYHRSNHFWGRIQFRVVFQNSQVPLTDFFNNSPYEVEIGFLARYGSVVDSVSKWSDVGEDIFRNSRVLIGASSFVDPNAKVEILGRVSQVGLGSSTYFGFEAGLNDDLSGNINTAFGHRALKNVIGSSFGYQNTAVGAFAGMETTTGYDNAFIGRSAGQENTTGNLNVAVGSASLLFNLIGIANTAIGYGSLINSKADHNTGLGFQSLLNVTTGTQNTSLGSRSLENIVSASQNIGIGYLVGGNRSSMTQTILIGNSAVPLANAQTNQIVIGHALTGRGSNTIAIGTAAVTDNFIAGNFNIVDGRNLIPGTVTGTRIGTLATQRIAFWNKTPIVQPTNAILGATLVSNGGVAVTDTDTFGGYTIKQLAAILINTGLTA